MMRLGFDRALSPEKGAIPLDFSLGRGLHAIVGSPADGLYEVAPLAGGVVRARSGRVIVDGRDPHADPALRARIGATTSTAKLPDCGRVEQLLDTCARARGGDPRAMLDALGLGFLVGRRLATLSAEEARIIELSIALATPEPLALVLTEPFANPEGTSRSAVLDAIARAERAGACVLVATASVADAADLGGHVHLLESGRIARTLDAIDAVALPGRGVELRVATSDPRALSATLLRDAAVVSAAWDADRGASIVSVRGADLDALALAIARSALATSARIVSITPMAPSLDEVRAASSGLALAAYHAAYRYGSVAPRMAPPDDPPPVALSSSEGSS